MIPVFRPSMDAQETNEVKGVLESGWVGLGPKTEEFEKALEVYLGNKHIITTNSATAALHLALIVAGVTEGDEVISPSLTFVSTNHVILYQKATPVFCDADPETLCADPKDVIKKITSKTKAIIVVHYGGHAVDMDPILMAARKKNIMVIEDAAHALGGKYKGKMLGTIGDFGCFSFHAVKAVAMGDGGAIFTKSKKTAAMLKAYRWMGISKDTWKRQGAKKYSWQYDVQYVGYKYHTNDILSAIGLVQLGKLPQVMKRKWEIFNRYNKAFSRVNWLKIPVQKSYTTHALHNYCIKTEHRDALSSYLADQKISTTVHYEPNHFYPIYKKYAKKLPVTEKLYNEILLLPFYYGLSDQEIDYIIEKVKSFKP